MQDSLTTSCTCSGKDGLWQTCPYYNHIKLCGEPVRHPRRQSVCRQLLEEGAAYEYRRRTPLRCDCAVRKSLLLKLQLSSGVLGCRS